MSSGVIESSFRRKSALLTSAVVASAALLVTAFGASEVWRLAAARHADNHLHHVEQMLAMLDRRVDQLDAVLRTANALYTLTGEVGLAEWRPMLEGLLASDSGGVIVRIGAVGLPRGGLEALDAPVPPTLVGKFVQPDAGTAWATGIDEALSALVFDELRESARSGEPRLSRPIRADEYDVGRPVCILVRPMLLEEESSLLEAGQASPTMIGWAFAVLDLPSLLPSVDAGHEAGVCVDDRGPDGGCLTALVGAAGDLACDAHYPSDTHPRVTRSVSVFGRNWRVTLDSAGHAVASADSFALSLVVCAGVALAALLGGVTWLFLRTQARARDLAAMAAEIEAACDDAQAASRAKSDFLANMSHEIRTPMTAILGYAELIARDDLPRNEAARCIDTIRRNGDHLLTVINDILDISKIEAGRLVIERTNCAPLQVAREAAALVRSRAASKGLAFTVHADGATPSRISTDPTRLRQILVNLLGNAVKFTDRGAVRLGVRMATDHESRVLALRFEIADTGPGIPDDQLRRLFRPFVQADESTTRRFGGTGLGLAISRSLAQALGGEISVESRSGEGSTFSVVVATGVVDPYDMLAHAEAQAALDAPQASAADPDVRLGTPLEGRRILLVEDGLDNQRLLSFLLRRAGAEVEVAGNGREAVERVAGDDGFDLVVMDMQMPEMDGYSAARLLRERGVRTPILALTAHAMSGDREKCLAAGCDEYLTKPVDRRGLVDRCAALAMRGRRRAAA